MEQTRRTFIGSTVGFLTWVGWEPTETAGKTPRAHHYRILESELKTQNMKRKAFVTLPGVSRPTIYENIHAIMKGRNPPPLILMDRYDYDRLWGQVVLERGQKEQMIFLLLDELIRRDLLRTIDYRKFYAANKQRENLLEYQETLRLLSDDVVRQAAVDAADGFLNICYGDYQASLRRALGGWDATCNRASSIEQQREKMNRGTGHTHCWNDRIFGQYMAALEVANTVDQRTGLEVVGVIGQGDSAGIDTVVENGSMDFNQDVVSISNGSIDQINRPNPDRAQFERDVLDEVSEIARETTGTQHQDWHILGSRLSMMHLPELFRRTWGTELDAKTIAADAKKVLNHIEKESADNKPANVTSQAEYVAEQHEISQEGRIEEIENQLDSAIELANSSREFRELVESANVPTASIFVAATVKMDPQYRYNQDDLYRRAVDVQNRLKPMNVSPHEVEHYSNRGGFRRGNVEDITRDWYQQIDRAPS